MESTQSIWSAIIAAAGAIMTTIVARYVANHLKRVQERDEEQARVTGIRLEGGWAAFVKDIKEWSAHVEEELKKCMTREEGLRVLYQESNAKHQACEDEIASMKTRLRNLENNV